MYRLGSLILMALAAVAAMASTAAAQLGPALTPSFVPDEVVVGFAPGSPAATRAAARGAANARVRAKLPDSDYEVLAIPAGESVADAVAAMRGRRGVRFAEPNFLWRPAATPNDYNAVTLHNLARIDMPRAWDYERGSRDVRVAVIDSGIAAAHSDLVANIWTNEGDPGGGGDQDGNGKVDDTKGWDFVSDDNTPQDGSESHGTHVSGILGAVGDNGTGITGVSWATSIIPLRVCGPLCSTADQAAAIQLADGYDAQVANMSIEGTSPSAAVQNAIADASDMLVVAAAGNGATSVESAPTYPCSYPAANVICVAATGAGDALASYSNFGPASVDLGAPGGYGTSAQGTQIRSTIAGGYSDKLGTSMAAPHVSGVAALLWDMKPAATVAEVRAALLSGVDAVPALAGKVASGGRLNAFKALAAFDTVAPDAIIDSSPVSPSADTTPTFSFHSTERNVTFECRLDTPTYAPCASPLTYPPVTDGHHDFAVRAKDAHGNLSDPATAEFDVDTTGPVAAFASGPGATTSSANVRLVFTFAETPVTVECDLDGEGFVPCSSPRDLTVPGEGTHRFTVRATDALGNLGTATYAWVLDRTAPGVTITSGPSDLSVSDQRSPTFAFTASEPVTFTCRLDSGPPAPCTGAVTYPNLANGSHTVEVRATDAAGNAGEAQRTWTVDAAPNAVITSGPSGSVTISTATFAFEALDGVAYRCSLDAAPFDACQSPVVLRGLADAPHTFRVQASDRPDRWGPAAVRTWTVDSRRPTVTITGGPDGLVASRSARLTFTVDEAVTSECQVDGGAFVACSSPYDLSGLADGGHIVTIRGRDAAGNEGTAGRAWTVDATPPVTRIDAGPTGVVSALSVTFGFRANEASVVFSCRFDEGAWSDCSSPLTLGFLPPGAHVFAVRATDAAGNVGAPAELAFTIAGSEPAPTPTATPKATATATAPRVKAPTSVAKAVARRFRGLSPAAAAAVKPFRVRYRARSAGELRVSLAITGGRTVALGGGVLEFFDAGAGRLTVRLKRAARLRSASSGRLRVRASFEPWIGRAATATRTVDLRG